MHIVGITGSIASGKSVVTRMLGELGARTLSADVDARAALADGSPTLASVLAAFPEARSPGGALDRAGLAARIYQDTDARQKLEAITHPAIIARMRRAISDARLAGPGVLVYETPLLYEAGLEGLFDTIIAVQATPGQQQERLQARETAAGRPALTKRELTERLQAQFSTEEKARRAHFVVPTSGSLEETRHAVETIWPRLLHPQP